MSEMSGKAHAYDTAYFDGSAEPNPGGRMGMGWMIRYRDGSEQPGAAERAPAPENTNNIAEYLALIAALEAYTAHGGQGPLLVHGDSQLVILQMTGERGINSPPLYRLSQQAYHTAATITRGVEYAWVPREQNRIADQLASGMAEGQSQPLVYAATAVASVPPPLAKQIAALNKAGRASFKECLRLRVGGRDAFSTMRLPDLTAAAGEDCAALCESAFPGESQEMVRVRETALRWMLRGL